MPWAWRHAAAYASVRIPTRDRLWRAKFRTLPTSIAHRRKPRTAGVMEVLVGFRGSSARAAGGASVGERAANPTIRLAAVGHSEHMVSTAPGNLRSVAEDSPSWGSTRGRLTTTQKAQVCPPLLAPSL